MQFLATRSITLFIAALSLIVSCAGQAQQSRLEEIIFESGLFQIVGDLRLPEGKGPHPVVLFVHRDGPTTVNTAVCPSGKGI